MKFSEPQRSLCFSAHEGGKQVPSFFILEAHRERTLVIVRECPCSTQENLPVWCSGGMFLVGHALRSDFERPTSFSFGVTS